MEQRSRKNTTRRERELADEAMEIVLRRAEVAEILKGLDEKIAALYRRAAAT